jgi:hypothetical protein
MTRRQGRFQFEVPDGWSEATPTPSSGGTPLPLRRSAAGGAILISTADYVGAKRIEHTVERLRDLALQLSKAEPANSWTRMHPTLLCGTARVPEAGRLGQAWCLASNDAADVLFLSYHSDKADPATIQRELIDVERLLDSIRHIGSASSSVG